MSLRRAGSFGSRGCPYCVRRANGLCLCLVSASMARTSAARRRPGLGYHHLVRSGAPPRTCCGPRPRSQSHADRRTVGTRHVAPQTNHRAGRRRAPGSRQRHPRRTSASCGGAAQSARIADLGGCPQLSTRFFSFIPLTLSSRVRSTTLRARCGTPHLDRGVASIGFVRNCPEVQPAAEDLDSGTSQTAIACRRPAASLSSPALPACVADDPACPSQRQRVAPFRAPQHPHARAIIRGSSRGRLASRPRFRAYQLAAYHSGRCARQGRSQRKQRAP